MLSRHTYAFFVGALVGHGERIWLNRFSEFPTASTLEVVGFTTVNKGDMTEMSMAGPVTMNVDSSQVPGSLHVALVPHAELEKLHSESSFCCSDSMVKDKKCKKIGDVVLHNSYAFPVTMESLQNGFAGMLFKTVDSQVGLYYVTLVNCGSKDAKDIRFNSGELSIVGKKGYLPAEEAEKLNLYLFLSSGYAVALVFWGVWCSRWSDVLFKIHHYISVAMLAGLLEALCWYASLYHWNFIGHRWWSMMLLASLGTIVKQAVSYGVLLLACLGLGVTKPRLENKTYMQIFLLLVGFVLAEGPRMMALMLQNRVKQEYSTWWIVFLVTPGSFLVSLIYVWVFSALQATITDLSEKKQIVKLDVYQNLRMALGIACALAVMIVGYESLVVRRTDLSKNWAERWIFTDLVSHLCFFVILLVIAFLWRPNERSARMAFSEQVGGDGEPGDIQMSAPDDFQNVDVELGDDPAEADEFDFRKSVEEATSRDKKVPNVLE